MDILKIKESGTIYWNGQKIVNVKLDITKNILTIYCEAVQKSFTLRGREDQESIELADPKEVEEKTVGFWIWKKKVKFIPPGEYYLKERKRVKITSNCWNIIDFSDKTIIKWGSDENNG